MFFSGTPVSSTNKTDRHDITEILLKVTLNTLTLTLKKTIYLLYGFQDATKVKEYADLCSITNIQC
jgi:hypothetical protein